MSATVPVPLTQLAAEFVAANRRATLPAVAVDVARTGFADAIACMIAGRDDEVVRIAAAVARRAGGHGECGLLLGEERTTQDLAALVGATAAQALDFDDYAFACHPSAVLVPAILAVAPEAGAEGRDMIAAYVAGYQVWADLMSREPDHLHSRGWHPTSLFGGIGAAAAASSLLGLGVEATRHAIGLAASNAAGIMGNFGSMAKAYQTGRAAQAGVFVTRLAAAGMTANTDALESERGLMRTLSPRGGVDLATPPAYGSYERICHGRLNVKKYPTVGASQRVVDSVLAHVAEATIDLEGLERIEPRVSEKHAAVMPWHQADTPEQARFSLEFIVACALLHGRVGLAEMTPARVRDPRLQDLMRRVSVVTTTDYDPSYPVAAPYDFVTLTWRDGRQARTPPVRRARGHADVPLSVGELRAKFMACAAHGGISEDCAAGLFDQLQQIEQWKAGWAERLLVLPPGQAMEARR